MHHSDAPQTSKPIARRALSALCGVLSLATITGLATLAAIRVDGPTPTATGFAPPSLARCGGTTPGFLSGRFYGALEAEVDWAGDELRCGGMFRPGGQGLRLLFAPAAGGLLVVLGLDGGPESILDQEVPVNLTVIDESTGRFFNSGNSQRCYTRVSRVTVRGHSSDRTYDIGGSLYCTGALAAVNGPGSVTPGDFNYTGRISVADE